MKYVDGYVLPLPKKNLKAYLRMARMGYKMWKKYGALDYKGVHRRGFPKPMGHFVHENDETQSRRDSGVLVHRVQVAGASRSSQRQGYERDGKEWHAKGDAL
jgi:uncharacterized protein YbaA (DUF1428 family)